MPDHGWLEIQIPTVLERFLNFHLESSWKTRQVPRKKGAEKEREVFLFSSGRALSLSMFLHSPPKLTGLTYVRPASARYTKITGPRPPSSTPAVHESITNATARAEIKSGQSRCPDRGHALSQAHQCRLAAADNRRREVQAGSEMDRF